MYPDPNHIEPSAPPVPQSAALAGARAKLQFCSFWLDGHLFGVEILDVKEINRELAITPVFHAPCEVKGYVNIRGQIYLVLDLRLLLGFAAGDITPSSRIIIFKPGVGDSFGVLVDRVGDIVEIALNHIEERYCPEEASHAYGDRMKEIIKGECRLEDQLLIVLAAERFLNTIDNTHARR